MELKELFERFEKAIEDHPDKRSVVDYTRRLVNLVESLESDRRQADRWEKIQ